MVNLDGRKVVRSGETFEFTDSHADYPAGDGYTLKYTIANADRKYTVTSTADGDDHDFEVTATDWVAGAYRWFAYAEKDSKRYDIAEGALEVRGDPTAVGDHRTHVRKVLDAIESVLEGKASSDASSLSIGGKTIARYAPAELLEWRDKYRAELQSEAASERVAQGLGSGRKIRVRF